MRIAFLWNGITGRYGQWQDGLWAAMKIIEKTHEVTYHEPSEDIKDVDLIMYWESPCTADGPFRDEWNKVISNPIKKVLLFSGGPIKPEWFDSFALTFVESKINKDELDSGGIPNMTAFGINTKIFNLKSDVQKIYDGVHHGTCASWKRQWLVGEALGKSALVFGRDQSTDSRPFRDCRKLGSMVLDEQSALGTAELLHQSRVLVQTSDFWGGGQRCTLEGMACGLPVVVMKDSPKNCEYVNESFGNLVVEPDAKRIELAVRDLIDNPRPNGNHEYVMGKWTEKHYADNLLAGIEMVIKK